MEANELRSIQSTLKEKYRQEPSAAVLTLRARSRMAEGIACTVETGRAMKEAGLHPATGGDGTTACSGDMLLEALAACAGVSLQAVTTVIGVSMRDFTVTAEGELDFRGTLGVSKDALVGFQAIRVQFDIDTEAADDKLTKLIELTERYCVVLQTLRVPPQVSISRAERRKQ